MASSALMEKTDGCDPVSRYYLADPCPDTHIHAPQYANAGIFGKTTLLDWLKTYTYPLESSFSSISRAQQVYSSCVSRTLAHGTTTASYYATIHVESTKLLADLCLQKGQRALIGRVCMDHPHALVNYYRDESLEAGTTANRAIIDHIRSLDPEGETIAPILTPRSAISCTTEFLSALGKLTQDESLRIQTHLSENVDEIKVVHEHWPQSSSYTAVYDDHGLLTDRTILAHVIHVTADERKLIQDRGAKVSHCPVSNSALGSGICPVRVLLDEGITVGLGTDISGGYSPSILEAARHACLVSRLLALAKEDDKLKLSVEEVLWLATRGGAEVVGWKDRVGAFEVGMQWDAQLIQYDMVPEAEADDSSTGKVEESVGNVKVFGWESQEDRVAKWMYCGDDRNTRKVWVGGILVHTTGT